MVAAGVAVEQAMTPAVPAPAMQVGRMRADAPNRYGCVVSLDESNEETTRKEQAVAKAATDKENKETQFWEKWRAEARRAEEKLKGACGSPGEMAKPKGGVALLKGLYVSRVGKAPPVKWNCVPNEQNARGEGSLLVEARTRPLRNRYAYVTRPYPSHPISHTS
jgi:hypothetical protein